MGKLTPDVALIYERVNDVVYSRESGSLARTEVGRDYSLRDSMAESTLWGNIRRAAETHPGLRAELDRVIMFYRLLEKK
jgi:hypothetical protein